MSHSSPSSSTPGSSTPASHSARSTGASTSPAELSAKRLHGLALEAFRVGNRGRLSLCDVFRVLGETRLYLDLGYPSLSAYADACFQLRRSEAFEYVRVARALVKLTGLRDAFGRGQIGWSALKAVTRVATAESQSSWIEFSREHGIERTLAEARDALRRGRDAPRDGAFGLPNLDQKLVLRFPRSDMAKVRGWLEKVCATVATATGAEYVSLEQAVLFLCEKEETASPAASSPEGPAPASASGATTHRAQVVYQRCPDCTSARMPTRDGFVEVDAAEVERYEGSAGSGGSSRLDLDALAQGLIRLGIPAKRSKQMIAAAVASFSRWAQTEASVLQRALGSA